MKRLLLRWVTLAFSVFAASMVSQSLQLGFHAKADTPQRILTLMIGVAVLAFLNVTLGKILKILTLPLSCITLGLFSLVINAAILYLASRLGLGFSITDDGIKGFFAAFVASILISLINGVLGVLLPDEDDD